MMNYEIKVFPQTADDGSTYWTACFPAIPECVGGGDTPEEAVAEANENLSFYLEYLEDEGKTAPKEYSVPEYNGKISLRVPKSIHKALAEAAENDGVSINLLLNNAVSQYLGLKNFDLQFQKKVDALKEVTDNTYVTGQATLLLTTNLWEKRMEKQGKTYVETGEAS